MNEINTFMEKWKEKAIAYYTDLNNQYQSLEKEQQKEDDLYRKEHNLCEYSYIPNSISTQRYHNRMKFLRDRVSNGFMEHLIQYNGHSDKFTDKLSEQIKKESERKKKNLLNRIESKVGKIVHTSLNIGADGELNGIIEGKKGKVKIETVHAGGYNIQCLHFRVLIHDL